MASFASGTFLLDRSRALALLGPPHGRAREEPRPRRDPGGRHYQLRGPR